MKITFDKRRLIGRKIVRIDWRPFVSGVNQDSRTGFAYDPLILLDNGDELSFTVQETNVGIYGMCPNLKKATR